MTGTVVVSGASSGFGWHTTRLLASEGMRVVAIARRADRLADLMALHPDGLVHAVPADVRDREDLAERLGDLPDEFADIAAVVNNAGLSTGFGPISSAPASAWREMVDTNVMGVLNLTEVVLPGMVERGAGDVINIGSIAAHYPYLGGNVYGATKAFVHQLSLNMRVDLQGTGVRVTCIAPGMARTEFALVRHDGDATRAEQTYADVSPLSADDVAQTVAWCLSRPRHVNINMIELMPTDQPFGLGFAQRAENSGRKGR
jgi:NADP-dependent 3-hydroxy acid dehydrogenase YdfG